MSGVEEDLTGETDELVIHGENNAAVPVVQGVNGAHAAGEIRSLSGKEVLTILRGTDVPVDVKAEKPRAGKAEALAQYFNLCENRFSKDFTFYIAEVLLKNKTNFGLSFNSICKALFGICELHRADEKEIMGIVEKELQGVGLCLLGNARSGYRLDWDNSDEGREIRALLKRMYDEDAGIGGAGERMTLAELGLRFVEKLRNSPFYAVSGEVEGSDYAGLAEVWVKVVPEDDPDYGHARNLLRLRGDEVMVLLRGSLTVVPAKFLKATEEEW